MPKVTKKTALTTVEQYELNSWLQQHNIDPAKLRRSFTDVMPLARLLARYYPDLVDVNYYPPRNSVQSKISNWQLFNKRVLTRLGVTVTREEMDRVARSVPGSIDLLLFSIMRAHAEAEQRRKSRRSVDAENTDDEAAVDDDDEEDNQSGDVNAGPPEKEVFGSSTARLRRSRSQVSRPMLVRPSVAVAAAGVSVAVGAAATAAAVDLSSPPSQQQPQQQQQQQRPASQQQQQQQQQPQIVSPMQRQTKKPATEDKDVVMVNVRKQIGDLVYEQPHRMVLYSTYAQAADQLQLKNAKIERFNQMNAHLENVLQLKVEHIDELQQQLHLLHLQRERANAASLLRRPQRDREHALANTWPSQRPREAGGAERGAAGGGAGGGAAGGGGGGGGAARGGVGVGGAAPSPTGRQQLASSRRSVSQPTGVRAPKKRSPLTLAQSSNPNPNPNPQPHPASGRSSVRSAGRRRVLEH